MTEAGQQAMVPNGIRVPVGFDFVFPNGAICLGVDALLDFERRGQSDDQMRDKETGQRMWAVVVMDNDPDATRFGRSAEQRVRIAAATMPVLPPAQYPGLPPLFEFTDLTLTPYVDQRKCKGTGKCGGRLAYSLRATGVIAAATLPV